MQSPYINNSGSFTLSLNSPITVSGSSDFAITTPPAITAIPPGGSTTFQVTFLPTAAGTSTATLEIGNNDSDENPYNFDLQGVGDASPPFATCGGYDVIETSPGVYTSTFPGNLIVGDNGYNWLIGTPGPDLILGLGGPDDIWGKDGDDVICGGPGVDIILGQKGNDTLYGDEHCDWLIGGRGDDTLYGGAGWDDLIGNRGNDMLFGEEGHDVLLGGKNDDQLDGGNGYDFCRGNSGYDTITACEGASAASRMSDNLSAEDEAAIRRSNDGENGEYAIEQRIQSIYLPIFSRE